MQLAPETIREDLEKILRRLRPETTATIRGEDRLRDDLGLDSLHSMELLSEITERYEIDVELDDVQDLRTVDDVVRYLASVKR